MKSREECLAVLAISRRDDAMLAEFLRPVHELEARRVIVELLDDDSLDAKRDAFRAALDDSPAWAAYFASVGEHFTTDATRARRHRRMEA